jgi:hypothetical protein
MTEGLRSRLAGVRPALTPEQAALLQGPGPEPPKAGPPPRLPLALLAIVLAGSVGAVAFAPRFLSHGKAGTLPTQRLGTAPSPDCRAAQP